VTIPSGGTYAYDSTYNVAGLQSTLSYPTSTSGYRPKLQYGYSAGILQSIADANALTTVFWQANTMNPAGQVTKETLGNGVVTSRIFDPVNGALSSLTSGLAATPTALQNESYLYDVAGNTSLRQNNNVGLNENFYYDGINRLDHSTLNGTANLQMHYDAAGMGNIVSKSDVAAGVTWTYDPTRIHAVTQAGTGGPSYTYDANGNAMTRNGSTITWTSYNHPLQINSGSESVSFAYTQDHTRWSARVQRSRRGGDHVLCGTRHGGGL